MKLKRKKVPSPSKKEKKYMRIETILIVYLIIRRPIKKQASLGEIITCLIAIAGLELYVRKLSNPSKGKSYRA